MSNENSELDDLMSQLERYDDTVLDFDDTFIWEYLISVDECLPVLDVVIAISTYKQTSQLLLIFINC